MSAYTKSGIRVPTLPVPHPKPYGKRRSIAMGFAALIDPDGSVAWQEDDWTFNALHDAGEQNMLNVYLKEQVNVTKFLALLNDISIAETDGTMSAVTESKVAGTEGYIRPQLINTEWTDDGLISGDYRFSGAEKRFGPITTTALTATHAALCTTATGAGLLLLTLALSATTTVAINQSFAYILRWTQQ